MNKAEADIQNDLLFQEKQTSDLSLFNSKLFIDFDGLEEITISTASNTSNSQDGSEPQSPVLQKKISDCLSNELIEELETPFSLNFENSENRDESKINENTQNVEKTENAQNTENTENLTKYKCKNKFNQYLFFCPCYVTCDKKNNKVYVNPFMNLNGRYSYFYSHNKFENEKRSKKRNFVEREGDWACYFCKNLNFAFRKKCNICGASKEIENIDKINEKTDEKNEEKNELN